MKGRKRHSWRLKERSNLRHCDDDYTYLYQNDRTFKAVELINQKLRRRYYRFYRLLEIQHTVQSIENKTKEHPMFQEYCF